MRFNSRLLDEKATINDDGSVSFDSGVTYTLDEITALKMLSPQDVKNVHLLKCTFDGEVRFVQDPEMDLKIERSMIIKF